MGIDPHSRGSVRDCRAQADIRPDQPSGSVSAWTYARTLGPFGLRVEDTALTYGAIAGHDPSDPASVSRPVELPALELEPCLKGTVIGVPSRFFFDRFDPEIADAVGNALSVMEGLGVELRTVRTPDVEAANSLHRLILLAEAASVHRRRLESHRTEFGDDVRALLAPGRFVLATEYLDAQRARREFCREFDSVLLDVDALAIPAVPIPTARIGELEIEVGGKIENVRLATTRNVRALNLTGLPVLSVPCGFRGDGMPVGMQIVGPKYGEAGILAIGHAYEQARIGTLGFLPWLKSQRTAQNALVPKRTSSSSGPAAVPTLLAGQGDAPRGQDSVHGNSSCVASRMARPTDAPRAGPRPGDVAVGREPWPEDSVEIARRAREKKPYTSSPAPSSDSPDRRGSPIPSGSMRIHFGLPYRCPSGPILSRTASKRSCLVPACFLAPWALRYLCAEKQVLHSVRAGRPLTSETIE